MGPCGALPGFGWSWPPRPQFSPREEDDGAAGVLAAMPQAVNLWLCGLDCYRGLAAEALQQRAADAGVPAQRIFTGVAEALEQLPSSGVCLVAGSFHTVEAATLWLNAQGNEWNCI